MRIYLAGPMRGYPQFNFPAFHAATDQLRQLGHEVFSPAEYDVSQYGDFASTNKTGDESIVTETHGFDIRKAMHTDLSYICLEADAVVYLPGSDKSKGANAEMAAGRAINIQVLPVEEVLAAGPV